MASLSATFIDKVEFFFPPRGNPRWVRQKHVDLSRSHRLNIRAKSDCEKNYIFVSFRSSVLYFYKSTRSCPNEKIVTRWWGGKDERAFGVWSDFRSRILPVRVNSSDNFSEVACNASGLVGSLRGLKMLVDDAREANGVPLFKSKAWPSTIVYLFLFFTIIAIRERALSMYACYPWLSNSSSVRLKQYHEQLQAEAQKSRVSRGVKTRPDDSFERKKKNYLIQTNIVVSVRSKSKNLKNVPVKYNQNYKIKRDTPR